MLFSCTNAALLLVDVQEKLLPAIDRDQEILAENIRLCRLAAALSVPVAVSEHCVDKIGATHPDLHAAAQAAGADYIRKQAFSAAAEGFLADTAVQTAENIIVAGIETHVCVLQTVWDLLAGGKKVFLAADAVSSRKSSDSAYACARMRQWGAEIVSTEMLAFEALGSARNPLFSPILKNFIK